MNDIKNPIVLERADPWVLRHDDYYYFTGSVPGYQTIEIRRAKSLNQLQHGEVKQIWQAHESGPQSVNLGTRTALLRRKMVCVFCCGRR